MNIELTDVIGEVSEATGRECVVAGGAVRDALLGRTPKDYDVFVRSRPHVPFDFKREQGELVRVIGDKLSRHETELHHASEPYLIRNYEYRGSVIQVMVTPYHSATELLNTFDWNTCLFARTKHSFVCKERPERISTNQYLRLHSCTYPLSTLRRGFRFSERFGMKIRREDIEYLCRKVTEAGIPIMEAGSNGNR